MRYTWITDPHIDHLECDGFSIMIELIKADRSNGVILTGDISCAATCILLLKRLHREIKIPIYFVLGNHDFHGSWIETVRKAASMLEEQHPDLRYLTTQACPIELAPGVGLIGHDSWYDARCGNYAESDVQMEDQRLIKDFTRLTKTSLETKLNELGTEAAEHLRKQLKLALQSHDQVILAMHVPPFREASLYNGEVANDFNLPFYCCKAVGDVILGIMADAPEKQLLVLCGHTHHEALYQPLPNVKVRVGNAKYGRPRVQNAIVTSD